MNNKILLIALIISIAGCSLHKNSKFWTASQSITEEGTPNYKKIFVEEEALGRELNTNIKIKFKKIINNDLRTREYFNNDGMLKYDGTLKKSSRYKFSKIEKFDQFEPTISFNKKNLIFFDNKGSIINFNEESK